VVQRRRLRRQLTRLRRFEGKIVLVLAAEPPKPTPSSRFAAIEQILGRARGRSADLLPFDQVRQMLRAEAGEERQLRDIPLDAIVGSVGRYQDFTRTFLPRRDADEQRWAGILAATSSLVPMPPIEVYQIGEVYFVLDGNHRVSVARAMHSDTIQAYVLPFTSRVSLPVDASPDDLIIRGEYADFLEQTRLDETRQDADLLLTAAGQYRVLLEHIEVHRYYRGIILDRTLDLPEAAAHWYDTAYLPALELMRERNLLRGFPNRTNADLYLWLYEHREELEAQLGWEVSPERAADDLVRHTEQLARDEARVKLHRSDQWLFNDILIPINGRDAGWEALEQAISIAQREDSMLYGLHIVRDEPPPDDPELNRIAEEFEWRCTMAGVRAQFAVEAGPITRTIVERSRWVDMVVLSVSYPPGPHLLERLTSGLHQLVRSSIRPVLAVPQRQARLTHMLLAYDGSPKAQEALYLATYLTARWQTRLTVATIADHLPQAEDVQDRARHYLEAFQIDANYRVETGPCAELLVRIAKDEQCELIVIGGYGRGVVGDLMLGSTADAVLRSSRIPTLICQ
jgi:nucleotide-binding universal stress UspA family protein